MTEKEEKAIKLLEHIKNNSWTTLYIMSRSSKDAETLINLIEKQQKALEQKDKEIDLMADFIDDIWTLDDEQEDCFIPREFSNIDDCIKKSCKVCIKQYFQKKAREENG